MKHFLLTLFLSFTLLTGYSQKEKLTNQSVLDMIEIGFDEGVIVAKIKSSLNTFNTSIDSLKQLKEKGVSNEILKAMLEAAKMEKGDEFDKTGVYIVSKNGEVKILPSIFSGTKTSKLAGYFTSGVISDKTKSTIHNPRSRNVVEDGNCSFKFYFRPGDEQKTLTSDWRFRTSTSPNEFALIRLSRKGDSREIEVGTENIYAGTSKGVNNKNVCPCTIEQIDEYTFKVTPTEPLLPGEYCFYFQGMIPENNTYKNQSVFDFSVPGEEPKKKKEYDEDLY